MKVWRNLSDQSHEDPLLILTRTHAQLLDAVRCNCKYTRKCI